MNLKSKIREVQDFPKEGINFKDVTTLLQDGAAYRHAIDECARLVADLEYDVIVGPEARGFLVGAPLAYAQSKPFVPVRKPGKLPSETLTFEYELEYGTDSLQIHKDAILSGQKVLITDDLLATGGTVSAIVKMIESLGGEVVGLLFLMELDFLEGRKKIGDYRFESLIRYDA
jgi:adenine phosphoribosyltransferase